MIVSLGQTTSESRKKIHSTPMSKAVMAAWFSWQVDLKGVLPPDQCMSEDFVACRHWRNLGYKIIVDTSIICRHIGFAQSTPGKFDPLDVVQVA